MLVSQSFALSLYDLVPLLPVSVVTVCKYRVFYYFISAAVRYMVEKLGKCLVWLVFFRFDPSGLCGKKRGFLVEGILKEAFPVERLLESATGGCKHLKLPGYRATGTAGGCLAVGS